MNIRSLLAAASLVASMAFPSIAGAQVQFRAGIHIGAPAPRYAAPVVVAPAPIIVAQPAAPVFVVRHGYRHHRREVIIARRHGGRHWRHWHR